MTVSCFIATYLGISVEDPARQRELTVYTSSVAADTVFRTLVSRGWAKPIPHGRTLIFMTGLAISSWLHARKRCTPGTHTSSMNWIAGHRNAEKAQIVSPAVDNTLLSLAGISPSVLKESKFKDLFWVLSGFIRGFSAGIGLRLIGMILSRHFTARAFLEKLRFSSFLGLLVGLYRLGVALTSKADEPQSTFSALLSGAAGGLSSFLYPSIELSMFAAAKTVDALLRTDPAADTNAPHHHKRSPKSTQLVKLTFAACCALVFYAVVFENHNVRPSYMKFLHTTSAGHLRQMPSISKGFMAELKTPNLTPPGAFDF